MQKVKYWFKRKIVYNNNLEFISYTCNAICVLIETERPKKLGVFINPIGGSQNSLNVYSKTIAPLFRAANIVCDVMGKHAEF